MAIIKNWLGRKRLQFLETFTQTEQEKCYTTDLFTTLNNKVKPQYNETIKSLQFQRLCKQMRMQKTGWADLDLQL